MKVITILSQKGGAGKTTLAIHLAVAAHHAGYGSAIFDLDPQATAETWGQWREDNPPEVVSAKAATLDRSLERARGIGVDLAVLDTPGAAEGAALSAARAADLILIPCRPRSFDLAAARQSVSLAKSTGRPTYLVFNGSPPRHDKVRADAIEVATALGVLIAPPRLAERAAFHRSVEEGRAAQEVEPEGKAAIEVEALWVWTCEHVHMAPRRIETRKSRHHDERKA